MKRQPKTTQHYFPCEGGSVPIVIRKHPKSKRMVIRYQLLTNSLTLTLPRYVSLRQGLSFIEEKREWVLGQMRQKPAQHLLSEGSTIPVFGKNYEIRHMAGRGVVHRDSPYIMVPGDPEFLTRRLRDWLKKTAKAELQKLATEKSKCIGRSFARLSVRDTSSHWGSCNQSGNLSFSWRLIFAPYEVLDYVVAHEVAHLCHLNHSPQFWQLVATLCPHYEQSRNWLKVYGSDLFSY